MGDRDEGATWIPVIPGQPLTVLRLQRPVVNHGDCDSCCARNLRSPAEATNVAVGFDFPTGRTALRQSYRFAVIAAARRGIVGR
jgi:hypothetical protein